MKNRVVPDSKILEWSLFGVIFFSCSPWPFWTVHIVSVLLMYGSLLLSISILWYHGRLLNKGGWGLFAILSLYFFLFQILNEVQLSSLLIALSFVVSKKILPNEGDNIVNMLTNYVFISIVIPLPLWIVHQTVYPFPEIGVIDVSSWKNGDANQVVYLNHLFFITVEGKDFFRFYSWYDEPGVLGTLSAMILWANQFRLNNFKNLTIAIGSIFTFSLAFILLSALGLILSHYNSLKKLIISLFIFCFLAVGTYYTLQENPAFQLGVVERVRNPIDITLDNRTSFDTNRLWREMKAKDLQLTGLGSGSIGVASSYKHFIICYGYIGVIIILFVYINLMRRKSKREFFTLLIFFLSFLQRPNLFSVNNAILFSIIISKYCYEYKNKS